MGYLMFKTHKVLYKYLVSKSQLNNTKGFLTFCGGWWWSRASQLQLSLSCFCVEVLVEVLRFSQRKDNQIVILTPVFGVTIT